MVDVQATFVDGLFAHLRNNPIRASEDMSTVVKALTSSRSTQRRLTVKLSKRGNNLLMLLEHCFIHHREIALKKLGGGFNLVAAQYTWKMLEFLDIWLDIHESSMQDLFLSGIIERSLVGFCTHDIISKFPPISFHLCNIMKKFLGGGSNGSPYETESWFRIVDGPRIMEKIAEGFSETCFRSGETRLLVKFLDVVEHGRFYNYQNHMINGVFRPYLNQTEGKIKEKIDGLDYNVMKDYFSTQLMKARVVTAGFDCRLRAAGLKMICEKLMEIEMKQKMVLPAMKEFFLRRLLIKHEPRIHLHDQYVEDILGLERDLTPYEKLVGEQRQRGEAKRLFELRQTDRNLIQLFVESYEFPRYGPVRPIRAMMSYRTSQFYQSYFAGGRSGNESDTELDQKLFTEYYQDNLDSMTEKFLPEILGSDIDFGALTPEDYSVDDVDDSTFADSDGDAVSGDSYDDSDDCDVSGTVECASV